MDRRKFLHMIGATATATALAPIALHATATEIVASPGLHFPWKHKKLSIAHRGASAYAPENTLESYRLAIKQGADLVEQDLQITKDGVLVCMHDTTLQGFTDVEEVFPDRYREVIYKGKTIKTWPIYDFTLNEVKRLKSGSYIKGQYAPTEIPTWQEAIEEIRGKAGLCPETKGPDFYGKFGFNMEKLVAVTLKKNGLIKRGADSKTPILMQSFSLAGLLRLRENGVDLPTLFLQFDTVKNFEQIIKISTEHKFDAIGPYKDHCTQANVQQAHLAGLKVIPYTFKDDLIDKQFGNDMRAEMSYYLYEIGIDGLFTNNPDLFPRKRMAQN